MKKLVFKLIMMVVGFGLGARVSTARAERLFVPQLPSQLEMYDRVDFYLLTAGVGPDLASRFGHTGIRIVDPFLGTQGLDAVYNWGRFSFDTPGFGWKFFRGSLTYSMGVRTFKNDVRIYEEAGRRLVMEPLRLTARQKMALYAKIALNARPENRDFQYQYWYKNCATIPRDLIDQTLHGGVYQAFAKKPAGHVFRDYVRLHLSTIPFVASGLDIMMNGQIDQPITQWEEMFLPGKLREHLQSLPAFDDEGKPLEGIRLLGASEILVDRPENFRPFIPDYVFLTLPLALCLVGAMVMMIRAARGSASFYRWLGMASVSYGVLYGLWGCVLVFNWAFSGHSDGWANRNLMVFWPTDLYFVAWGIRLVKQKSPLKNRFLVPHGISFLAVTKVGLVVLLAVLSGAHWWTGREGFPLGQDMSRVLAWFGSGTLLFIPLFLARGVVSAPQVTTSEPQKKSRTEGQKATPLESP